ncbi:MAG: hypothetical protein H6557_32320 [Lewinellaceae bacterium]|nr:hypothetical protein [Phaeodactylibacter sp.]MCB9041332.1 hypothetical protein [Lewinellaceae bacterium]
MKKLTFWIISTGAPLLLSGQVYLNNASFEGNPQDATVPAGWFPCELGTTPDIMPGPWGVYQEAAEGGTYLGLITREDGSWESIGQRLPQALQPRECYAFTLELAHSNTYAGYNKPLGVRIWGGATQCAKNQLLFKTGLIKNTDWEEHEVQFVPKQTIRYIVIEAYYRDGPFSYQGNILIDNISAVKKCTRASLE